MRITLERKAQGSRDAWESIGQGVTNSDGRVPTLLPPAPSIAAGIYRSGNLMICDHLFLQRCFGRISNDHNTKGFDLPKRLMLPRFFSLGVSELQEQVLDLQGLLKGFLHRLLTMTLLSCRVIFETEAYMRACKHQHPDFYSPKPFYPEAVVQFEITPPQTQQHFHIPLTWNPYGYSTYRGS